MADHDPEHDRLIERLGGLGRQPVDPALQSAHLTAMAGARPAGLRPKLRVAAAFLAGLLLGGSGLAAAGALPDGAQDVAHRMFDRVGIQVPEPDRHHGPECGDEVKRNHGQYVRDDKSLAQSACGKPIGPGGDAVDEGDEGDDGAARGPKAPKGPCQGPPPWALDRSMTPEEKAAAQAERRAQCGDEDAEPAEPEGSTEGAEAQRSATTTTSVAPTTTTTAAPPTTSTTSTTNAADPTTTATAPSG